jgi:hypothetical protein
MKISFFPFGFACGEKTKFMTMFKEVMEMPENDGL